MDVIQRGLDAGELVDVTDRPELWVKPKDPGSYTVEDTGLKTYSGTRAFFRSCGIDDCPSARDEDQVVYSTGDPEEQEQIEEALRSVPVHKAAPLTTQGIHLTRKVNGPVGLVLPPGMDDPERYLLR